MAKHAWWKQTRREQDSYRNTVNLFFGALLGANLGTLGTIEVRDYVFLIAVLLGAVMSLQLVTAARSRAYALSMLAVGAGVLAVAYLDPDVRPRGLSESDFQRILATLSVWLASIASVELTPVAEEPEAGTQR